MKVNRIYAEPCSDREGNPHIAIAYLNGSEPLIYLPDDEPGRLLALDKFIDNVAQTDEAKARRLLRRQQPDIAPDGWGYDFDIILPAVGELLLTASLDDAPQAQDLLEVFSRKAVTRRLLTGPTAQKITRHMKQSQKAATPKPPASQPRRRQQPGQKPG